MREMSKVMIQEPERESHNLKPVNKHLTCLEKNLAADGFINVNLFASGAIRRHQRE